MKIKDLQDAVDKTPPGKGKDFGSFAVWIPDPKASKKETADAFEAFILNVIKSMEH